VYVRDPNTEVFHAIGLFVLTLAGDQISEMTRFDNGVFPWFGLPRSLPGW
jgi:RNA polymerase sigma-70 factor (ECF subfamily)